MSTGRGPSPCAWTPDALPSVYSIIDQTVRYFAAAAFFAACIVAGTHWLVRTRRINPFGGWARLIRRSSDPILQPLERRLLGAGGNPQDAAWVLVLCALGGGLVLVYVTRWLLRAVNRLAIAGEMGPRAILTLIVDWTVDVLLLALFVRVISSWFGIGQYRRWMRPFVFLTEWLLAPIRRTIPPLGPLDMSPFVAGLILIVLRLMIFGLIF